MAKKQYNTETETALTLKDILSVTGKMQEIAGSYGVEVMPRWKTNVDLFLQAVRFDGTNAGRHFVSRYINNSAVELWNAVFDGKRYINRAERKCDDKGAEKLAFEASNKFLSLFKT